MTDKLLGFISTHVLHVEIDFLLACAQVVGEFPPSFSLPLFSPYVGNFPVILLGCPLSDDLLLSSTMNNLAQSFVLVVA